MANTSTIQSELLRSFVRTHLEAVDRATTLTSGMSEEAASWKPSAKAWCVAECIEHLNESLGTYREKMRPALEAARRANRTGAEPFARGTFIGRWLVGFLRKGPGAKRASAPGTFQPRPSARGIEEIVERFREECAAMVELAESADGLALGKIVFGTPVSPLLRVSLAQAFEIHQLHTPRHLDQAERVTRTSGFPG